MFVLGEKGKNVPQAVRDLMKCFELKEDKLKELIIIITECFNAGLLENKSKSRYKPLAMIPTYLSKVPTGNERGRAIAIDLASDSLRIFKVFMHNKALETDFHCYDIPIHLTVAKSPTPLFDYVADCLKASLKKFKMTEIHIPYLAFSFAFPCNQKSLCSATLYRWTKGYKIDGAEGKDIVKLLKDSCTKKKIKVDKFPLVNDTTGTLMAGAFKDKDAAISVINDNGTNACYIEQLELVKKWLGSQYAPQLIINTEWGAFGEKNELDDIKTKYDKIIDSSSLYPGQQVFEKLMSAMHIGEIVRLCIKDLVEQKILFNGIMPKKLSTSGVLPATFLYTSNCLEELSKNFEHKFDMILEEKEAQIIDYICDAVIIRGASLTAMGLSALLKRIPQERCVIAAEGCLFKKHLKFVEYTTDIIKMLLPQKNFEIITVDDGSGVGAALSSYISYSSSSDSINDYSLAVNGML